MQLGDLEAEFELVGVDELVQPLLHFDHRTRDGHELLGVHFLNRVEQNGEVGVGKAAFGEADQHLGVAIGLLVFLHVSYECVQNDLVRVRHRWRRI